MSTKPLTATSVFVSQFHVTRGSEVACQYPSNANVDGLEGKTLPAGGHALSNDMMYVCH